MSVLDDIKRPAGWACTPFGRVARRVQESGRPDLEPLSVFLGAGVIRRYSREDNHNRLGEDMSKYLVVQPGDIVFNKLRTWQGGLGASQHEGIVSPAYFVCRPSPDFDSRFLQYLLLSSAYLQELTRLSKWQPPSQFDIGWEQLKLLAVMSPPFVDQRTIADFLDRETGRIDALITAKRRMVELLEERIVSVAAEAIDDCGQHRVIKLGQVLERIIDYRGATPEKTDGGVPLLTASNVIDGRIDLESSPQFVSPSTYVAWMRRGLPQRGDVLLTTEAPLGEVAVMEDLDVALAQRLMLLRPRRDLVRSEFLHVYLRSPQGRKELLARASGSTVMGVRTDRLRDLPVIVPSFAAQDAVVRRLAQVERSARAIVACTDRQIDLLAEHRQALITAAVTGELDVGVAA